MTPETQALRDRLASQSTFHHIDCDVLATFPKACSCGLAELVDALIASASAPDARLVEALRAAQFAAHQLARHPGHPAECRLDRCADWLALTQQEATR